MKLHRALAGVFTIASAVGFPSVNALRDVMYLDQWHSSFLETPGIFTKEDFRGITHVILAFMDPANFTQDATAIQPCIKASELRPHFDNDTQIGVSLGGWGDYSTSFSQVSTEGTRAAFATHLSNWLAMEDLDFVDIDWEYPGGNGADYLVTPNDKKTKEITDFPLFLQAIKKQIGTKSLSIAVGGTATGMLAFPNKAQSKAVWDIVDFVNIMAYDFVNRRSNATAYHTDVNTTMSAVQSWMALGLPPQKVNLGFGFYAKYFELGISAGPCPLPWIGCLIAESEDPVTGADNFNSGILTFEQSVLSPNRTLYHGLTPDGSCGVLNGATTGFSCNPGTCCGASGWCGSSAEHCRAGCQTAWGGCQGPDTVASLQNALKYGQTDWSIGGQSYLDTTTTPNLFWTFETVELMQQKYDRIVAGLGLGGVMGWSLGEDSYDWAFVKAMQNMTVTWAQRDWNMTVSAKRYHA
ncbi:Uu.00g057670.m01.CDS01 [Anthostomella pinea]|uniref:chitinase n=1 Tax=Anthostomella pinea TaxID=933095 RepID=A0AAI8VSW2_9PEZI|nr:Uu.00g057670.m01.CDS01 [Anthostomella pinea]